MEQYIKLKKSNCKNCYKCIRSCPVKAISFSDNQAQIIADECILCGRCFVACPQNAKEIRSDVESVKALMENYDVYASVAPSFAANYSGADIDTMAAALKRLGFAGAEETAVGAAEVKARYDELLGQHERSVMISSCCSTVNLLIRKYYPEALPCLANVITPMEAHGLSLKKRFPSAKVVFIGPCISKKSEADGSSQIDAAITFEELGGWLSDKGITVEKGVKKPQEVGKTRLFPTTGGILKSMDCNCADYDYLAVDGIENCVNALKSIADGGIKNCFIEMSACSGSCVGGPAMDNCGKDALRGTLDVSAYAGKDDFEHGKLTGGELTKQLTFMGVNRVMPGSKAIEEILRQMGKLKPEDELNCGSCGYNTCREKAAAVLNGKADLSMCLPFLKEKAETFSDHIINNTPNGIVVLNENMQVQQINAAACEIMNITNPHDVLGEQVVRILDPLPFFDVLKSKVNVHDKRTYLAEYNRYVEQTIIYDESYHVLMLIMRDVTEEEQHREERDKISRDTIEITDKVVEKQMRIVQEIASLLGETAAETKIAFMKLKESVTNDK